MLLVVIVCDLSGIVRERVVLSSCMRCLCARTHSSCLAASQINLKDETRRRLTRALSDLNPASTLRTKLAQRRSPGRFSFLPLALSMRLLLPGATLELNDEANKEPEFEVWSELVRIGRFEANQSRGSVNPPQ